MANNIISKKSTTGRGTTAITALLAATVVVATAGLSLVATAEAAEATHNIEGIKQSITEEVTSTVNRILSAIGEDGGGVGGCSPWDMIYC